MSSRGQPVMTCRAQPTSQVVGWSTLSKKATRVPSLCGPKATDAPHRSR